ncbi:hypothetical protein N665_0029s0045 [Sinapis alba]|nr:hypothetical protein N665_0029s0045 [Sinapis alba]
MDRYGALILIFLMICQLVSLSTARSFPDDFLPVTDGVIISGEVSPVSKTVKEKLATVVRCKSEDDPHFTAGYSSYVAGIYGSLVLNVLPKGSVPASGPSKRINSVKT